MSPLLYPTELWVLLHPGKSEYGHKNRNFDRIHKIKTHFFISRRQHKPVSLKSIPCFTPLHRKKNSRTGIFRNN